MGSAALNAQYSYLREMHESPANQSGSMDSNAAKGKAPATSVYPSPADEVINNFSAPSSPIFNEQQIAPSTRKERITLPPISSLVNQMPSPSSSPQLPVASYRSPAENFLRSPIKFSRSQDAPLFPDRPSATNEVARPQPLFGNLAQTLQIQPAVLSVKDQQRFAPSEQRSTGDSAKPHSHAGGLARPQPMELAVLFGQHAQSSDRPAHGNLAQRHTFPPGRKPKQRQTAHDIHMRRPISPSTPRYGSNDFWARQTTDPETYALPVVMEWQGMFTLPTPNFPIGAPPGMLAALAQVSPADATEYTRRHSTTVGRRDQSQKRKADSVVEMPPPKRTRKPSTSKAHPRPSVSPREAPLDVQEKKFRRRTNDANRMKAPADKVARDYSIYPDYCPPLSTLDGDHVNFPNIEWKATPQDVTNHEDCHLLHAKEIPVVSKLVLTPSDYIYIKRRFFANRLEYARKHHAFNINAAQLACKGADEHGITGIDVNKTSRLHKAFEKVGWLEEKHMQRFL